MTEEQRAKLAELLPKARRALGGTLDPMWDVVLDGEALLAGRRTLLSGTTTQVADAVIEELTPKIGTAQPMPGVKISNSSGITMKGNSFINCTGLGADNISEPLHHGNGNVSWPADWSERRRADWRKEHALPGAEWEPGQPHLSSTISVRKEMERIRKAIARLDGGDQEDLAAYAREIVGLRRTVFDLIRASTT